MGIIEKLEKENEGVFQHQHQWMRYSTKLIYFFSCLVHSFAISYVIHSFQLLRGPSCQKQNCSTTTADECIEGIDGII